MPALPDPASLPLAANLVLFAGAAGAVWWAGTRLARLADILAERTGLGGAAFGLLFLALATSLPELSTTVTASLSGDAPLATSNLFGSVVLQTAVLALADATLRVGPLTFFAPKPVLLLQATLLAGLLGLVLAGFLAGEPIVVGWVGGATIVIGLLYAGSLQRLRSYGERASWQPVETPQEPPEAAAAWKGRAAGFRGRSTPALAAAFVASAAAILVGGVTLAVTAGALAQQSGLGSSFVGGTFLAASTALPEVSATVAAVRIGAFSLAFSNILGSNSLMVGLLLVADLAYLDGPILRQLDRATLFGAAAGVVVTVVYLAGLIERRDRQIWRLGYDSLAVIAVYAVNLAVLYLLR